MSKLECNEYSYVLSQQKTIIESPFLYNYATPDLNT